MNRLQQTAPVFTGFMKLDHLLGGLFPGDLFLLNADPRLGKTSFALNVLRHAAVDWGRPGAFLSWDLQDSCIQDRLVVQESKLPYISVRDCFLTKPMMWDFAAAKARLDQAPIVARSARSSDLDLWAKRLARWKTRHGIDLVILDSLPQLHHLADEADVDDVLDRLARLARDLEIAVVVTSELPVVSRSRFGSFPPDTSDLPGGAFIQEHATAVGFIHRTEQTDWEWDRQALLDLVWNRRGSTGTIPLHFQPAILDFKSRVA